MVSLKCSAAFCGESIKREHLAYHAEKNAKTHGGCRAGYHYNIGGGGLCCGASRRFRSGFRVCIRFERSGAGACIQRGKCIIPGQLCGVGAGRLCGSFRRGCEPDSVSESDPASSSEAASSSASSSDAAHSQPASSAASSHPASSHPASSSEPSSTPSSSASAESAVDAKISAYVQEIKALQKRTRKRLFDTVSDSYNEYISHPVEERSLALKVSVVLGKSSRLTQIQNDCDKEFNVIIKELRQYLTDNGRDQSIADQAEREYKAEKDAVTKELTNLTYSQVTGKGEGAQWLQDHYAEWGS